MSSIADEVRDVLTLNQDRSDFRSLLKGSHPMNMVTIHVLDTLDKDTALVFFLNGREIGWLSGKKVAELAQKVTGQTQGE